MIRITFCLTRKEGMSLEEFQDYWLNKHAPLVKSVADTLHIRKYVQLHTRELPENDGARASRAGSLDVAPAIYDGVAELWWDSIEDLREAVSTEEGVKAGRLLLEDEAKFIDFSKSPLWYGEEYRII
ncbi:MAG: EthD domain-containing protein [Parvibaculaceae bacterium]